jgi:DNA-binding beta-propeller fold protein YncE
MVLPATSLRRATPLCILGVLAAPALGSACGSGASSAPPSGGPDAAFVADAGLPPLEPTPPASIDASARLDSASSPVVFDRLRGGVWTANGDVGTVTYANVDTAAPTQSVAREIAIGQDVTSVALSPDFTWLAAVDRAGATVSLVDATSGQVRRTLALGTHPRAAVWDAWNPRWLYVSLEDDGAIAVIDRTLGVVDHTVPVGRLPAGIGVSRLRDELAVTHRIDGAVTVVPLAGVYSPADQSVPPVDIPLAFQPPQTDDTQPSGAPFALESLAWSADGNRVWVPHELLANRHPFQFQRVLFPAVSVVDLAARAEVQTNPDDPLAVIAGRKLLFGAIDIPDAVGNTSIVSQPCAAVMHPNGLTAYVVACASEDLLTFDLTAGIAVDLLRNLPGDHPTGIALDDTGQRAFVVSDQSHSLLTLDTAGGSLVGHVSVLAGPLKLVANDPVDPQLRAGETLFFSANSAKNALPTTGNDWLSCGGCHLDGFVSTNQVVFEALHAVDPTADAELGHEGLVDMFSTASMAATPSFNPHDILAALLDQGGLAPDRTGADRAGQVDPSSPSAPAATMAQQLAHVVARDLPAGPSWLVASGDAPATQYDGAWCGNCHQPEYAAWQKSAHAHAAVDTMVLYGMGVEQQARGAQYSRQCAGCHDPVSLRSGDSSLASGRGVTCLGCHDVTRLIRSGGNADVEATSHDWTQEHVQRAAASLTSLRTPDFCASCHQQFVPGTGIVAIDTLGEWQASPFGAPASAGDGGFGDAGTTASLASAGAGATTTCVDCHMPDDGSGTHDHSAPGGNVYLAQTFDAPDFAATVGAKLSSALRLHASSAADGVHVQVLNTGAGHAFPTGVTDIREPWVEVQILDGNQKLLATYGGPDSTGLVPLAAARLGMDIAAPDGTLLYRHELTSATRIPFERVVPAQTSIELVVPMPASLPVTATELDAVLLYRNVRTQYYRAATGDATSHAPDVEVARVVVGQ